MLDLVLFVLVCTFDTQSTPANKVRSPAALSCRYWRVALLLTQGIFTDFTDFRGNLEEIAKLSPKLRALHLSKPKEVASGSLFLMLFSVIGSENAVVAVVRENGRLVLRQNSGNVACLSVVCSLKGTGR